MKSSFTREWLVAEAARQGLSIDDADAEAVFEWVAMIKAELARARPDNVESLEPAYLFKTAGPEPTR